MHREMKYSNVPEGSEWKYPNSETERIYLKLANGQSISELGTPLRLSPDRPVILVGLTRKGKTS